MIGVIVLRIMPYAALGAFLGAGYFAALGWNIRLYAGHGVGGKALLLHVLRLAVAIAAFALCARQGARPLLASFAGFLAVRAISVNPYRRALERSP
jgi:F1F0 ATPase subunit 2